jgi:DNA-binding transcriptional LysR family regulator
LTAARIDVAISPLGAPPGLEAEVLFKENFVCLVGSKRKIRNRRFTLKQYLELPHVAVDVFEGQQPPVDYPLSELGLKRNIALTIPFFVPAILAIANTDLVLTLPRRLLKISHPMALLKTIDPPRELESFRYFMIWHPRLTTEPAQVWFREQIREAARTV